MNKNPKKTKNIFKKLAISGIVTFIVLILAEITLSMLQIFPDDYYTGTPNSGFTWKINSNEITGIHQDSEVLYDELGARSISNYKDASHKIVAFGGSTTACFALTQSKTWPALLEKKLGDSYWVGNFGRPGNSSNHHVLQFEHILKKPELNDVKTVIIMQGVNDFVGYLISADRYVNSPYENLKQIAFQHIPDDYLPFYKQFTLHKLAKRAKKNILFYFNHKDHLTKTVMDIKALKKQSKIIEELPDLIAGLNHYEANINALIKQAKQQKIKLIFVMQATMWKPDLEQKYEDLIVTSGFPNNEAFYSTEALYTGMEIFNDRLKTVCDQNNISYIDLKLPKTTASFYDDFHFNESGAELTSNQISQFLKTKLKQ
ncbi:SGNH/GDSL hydrolase family protein [Lacinutrix jangbogonensis]|uniref:SGNH/GDSL hydrolase family protein n=1 Tax=Lacinutrix jangbogonensis TaxID=1469557 RepID=UPI00053DEA62|nr:SGNH/GDSL hydrolase family protein [Lacinutrix jangbogonensis]